MLDGGIPLLICQQFLDRRVLLYNRYMIEWNISDLLSFYRISIMLRIGASGHGDFTVILLDGRQSCSTSLQ